MEELEPGTLVIMMKNEDGSFSPVGVHRDHVFMLDNVLSQLSKNEAFAIKYDEKYDKRR